ncbi:MAG: hypothetical protein V1847_03775 [Candidatus Diapherotrites archaeon]
MKKETSLYDRIGAEDEETAENAHEHLAYVGSRLNGQKKKYLNELRRSNYKKFELEARFLRISPGDLERLLDSLPRNEKFFDGSW